jgi:hypothetical protein
MDELQNLQVGGKRLGWLPTACKHQAAVKLERARCSDSSKQHGMNDFESHTHLHKTVY